MAKWGRLKNILMTPEDSPTPEVAEVVEMIEEVDEVSSFQSSSLCLVKVRCRTPMGGYVCQPGEKPLTALGDSCPGPADYLPKFNPTKESAPHYSIVGKPKIRDGKRNVPGPSNYNTSGDISWKGKKVTLKGRCKSWFDEEAEKSISLLGKYKVNHLAVGTTGQKYKIGNKDSKYTGPVSTLVHPVDTKGFSTPGPNYRPNSKYWGRGPKKSFGVKSDAGPKPGPGPGDYDATDSVRGPSHSFGMKLPEPVSVQQSINKDSPGANTYDIGTTIGKAPAFSIAGRPNPPKEGPKAPCPSSYHPEYTRFDRYKAKTLAYRWFETEEPPKKPGPADYNVKHVNLKAIPSYTCRQRVKTSFPDSVTYDRVENENPGPGSYNLVKDFVANDNPSYSLRKRLEPVIGKDNLPGPNAYSSEKQEKPGAKRVPAFSMGKRLVAINSMKNTPGPGEYTPKPLPTARGKYTMTRRPKGKDGFVNPAPNLYSLPEVITAKNKGVALKSRASPYVYSGFRTNKLADPCIITMPVVSN